MGAWRGWKRRATHTHSRTRTSATATRGSNGREHSTLPPPSRLQRATAAHEAGAPRSARHHSRCNPPGSRGEAVGAEYAPTHTHTETHTQGKINARTGRGTRATRGSSSRAAVNAAQATALTRTAPPPQAAHHPFLNSWERTHTYTHVHALERASRRARAALSRRPRGDSAG